MLGQMLLISIFNLLKTRTSIDIFSTEKCKVTFGFKYMFYVVICCFCAVSVIMLKCGLLVNQSIGIGSVFCCLIHVSCS